MDLTVIIGMIGGLISIATGDLMEGGNPAHVIHLSSLIIVIPTAMFSAATGTEAHALSAAFKELKMVFKKTPINFEERIDQIVDYAIMVKKNGVLALEKDVQVIEDEFLKEALSMVVDGSQKKNK